MVSERIKKKLTERVVSAVEEIIEEEKGGKSSQIQLNPETKSIFTKIGVYGSNILGEILARVNDAPTQIGNGWGATGFAVFDIFTGNKNNKWYRLIKTGGFAWYVGECTYDVVSAFYGDFKPLANFPLDVAMAWHLGAESRRMYKEANLKGEEDKNKITFESDIKTIFDYSAFRGKLKSAFSRKKNLEGKASGNEDAPAGEKNEKKNQGGFFSGIREKRRAELIAKSEEERYFGASKVSLKDKKNFLFYYGTNISGMSEKDLNDTYVQIRKTDIYEQIKIFEGRKKETGEGLARLKAKPFLKRAIYWQEISWLKKDLATMDEILFKLESEKKIPEKKWEI